MNCQPYREAYQHKCRSKNDQKGSGAEDHWATFLPPPLCALPTRAQLCLKTAGAEERGAAARHVFLTRAVARYLLTETIGNTTMHTIATAAAAVGRNKTAILRAINAGKIAAAKDENGEWQIDAAELHRIYPPLRSASMQGNDMQPGLHQSPLLTPV